MTLTGGGTFEAPDRTRGGLIDTLEDALGDPAVGGLSRDDGQWSAPPRPPQAEAAPDPGEPPKGDEALARWVSAYVDHALDLARDRFIEVAGAQNEGVKAMIEGQFEGLHDPYKIFLKAFLMGVATLVLAVLMVIALGLFFLYGLGVARA